MISFTGEEFVQNMMRVVVYIREEVVVHLRSQLGWCGIIAGVETTANRTNGDILSRHPSHYHICTEYAVRQDSATDFVRVGRNHGKLSPVSVSIGLS